VQRTHMRRARARAGRRSTGPACSQPSTAAAGTWSSRRRCPACRTGCKSVGPRRGAPARSSIARPPPRPPPAPAMHAAAAQHNRPCLRTPPAGDVVIALRPINAEERVIKRVTAVAGDTVTVYARGSAAPTRIEVRRPAPRRGGRGPRPPQAASLPPAPRLAPIFPQPPLALPSHPAPAPPGAHGPRVAAGRQPHHVPGLEGVRARAPRPRQGPRRVPGAALRGRRHGGKPGKSTGASLGRRQRRSNSARARPEAPSADAAAPPFPAPAPPTPQILPTFKWLQPKLPGQS
jgi:hypothetical protein